MRDLISIATGGYLSMHDRTLSIATDGYLAEIVIIIEIPRRAKQVESSKDILFKEYTTRLKRDDEEIMLIIKIFLRVWDF
jgi:hypothetical protein